MGRTWGQSYTIHFNWTGGEKSLKNKHRKPNLYIIAGPMVQARRPLPVSFFLNMHNVWNL